MADLNASNLRRQMGNKVFLLAIMAAILVIPGYIGIGAAFVMYYGDEYLPAVYNPPYLAEQYFHLLLVCLPESL